MRPRLSLRLLGSPQFTIDDQLVTLDRRKAVALLAYLAVERSTHTRDSLSALLWPDYDQSKAFANLRHTLWEIQQGIGEGWLSVDRETMGLDPAAHIAVDVDEFESLIAKTQGFENPSLRIPILTEAVSLYRNHFLTGFSLKDAADFNEWSFAKSENLRHQLSQALMILSDDHCSLGQKGQAIPYARRLVSLDPLNEVAHRQLMQTYLQAGQHSAALKQYQTLEQLLRKELNLDPQPETRALYKKIRLGDARPASIEKPVEPVAPRHNFPLHLSRFIGRERQQEQILSLLAKHRLLTLAGAGGIGKTRLSLQVGQRALQDFPQGVWFIALDSLSDPALVPQTVASTFGIQERADRSLMERLIEFLHDKHALLVLDNCEHLVEACVSLITSLLQSCPSLKVLVTSRETLNMPGEATYFLPSLSLPEGESQLEELSEYEAIQLFTARATLAHASFTLTKENAAVVLEICRKVDGIPLAIELAAARVNILRVEEILQQLQASFALLSSNSRSILPRQQTLEASMNWSWGMLDDSEKQVLRQLSVFAGGWTLESAQAVCEMDTPLEILTLIDVLVRKSLIVVEQEAGRGTRYRFHEIVRQYAQRKLTDTGDETDLRTRHLKYFLHFAERSEFGLRGPERVDWLTRLNEELNNLRAALHWAEKTDVEAGLYLSGRLRRFWGIADLQEGIRWLEIFLDKSNSRSFPGACSIALETYGWLLTWFQQFERALSATEESLVLARVANYREGEADALVSIGNIKQFLDEPDAAITFFQESLALARSLNDPWREANAYWYWGWDRRDFQRSIKLWEKALALYRKTGDQIALANLLGVIGQFRVLNGEIDLAEPYLDEAMQLWKSNEKANSWENARIAKSLIAVTRGDFAQARTLLQEALLTATDAGNKMSYLWVRLRQGHVALQAGDPLEARTIFMETGRAFHQDGNTVGTVFTLEGMAALFVAAQNIEPAARLIGWADATRENVRDLRLPLEQANIDKLIAACIRRMGEADFSDVYDKGQKMSVDEAVTLAFDDKSKT